MTLETLKAVLDNHFGPPFLPEGHVRTKFIDTKAGRVLQINIGRRDIWIDEDGAVSASGTSLMDISAAQESLEEK